MEMIFVKLLNMSIAASWLILAVILLRPVLKRAPHWTTCLLWALVAIRLMCPFSVESMFSLIPSAEIFDMYNIQFEEPKMDTGINILNQAMNPILEKAFKPAPGTSVNPLHVWIYIAGILWAVGLFIMLLYAAVSFLRLRYSVREAALLRENIWLCDAVKSPFVLGVFRPRILLPSSMDERQMGYIIAHEQAHLARRDHWWKLLGFLLLAVYWFHPLCWIAYSLLCRDIELACDEKVISEMDLAGKKAYSHALVSCSAQQRKHLLFCPMAFAEVGVKERVKRVLDYKKPAAWITVTATAVCFIVAVCFLTNPERSPKETRTGGMVYAQYKTTYL